MTTDFGTDISTPLALDIDPFFSLASGFELLGQDLAARILTPAGGLIDDGAYGFDVRAYFNDDAPSPPMIAAGIRAQWLADERVEGCDVTVTFADSRLSIRARVETAEGPFTLTLSVSTLTVEMLRVSA